MRDEDKTQEQLINEVLALRKRTAELEALKAEHKRVKEELTKSEAQYRGLVEKAGAGIATTDLKGRFTFVNDALCKMIGYSKEELIGRPFADFIHPDYKQIVVSLFWNAFKHPTEQLHLEFQVMHKQGHIIHCYSNPTIYWHHNKIAGFNAIIHDITEQKRAEEALRGAEWEKAIILDSMSELVAYQDTQMRVIWANRAAGKSVGLAPEQLVEQLVGRHCYEIWHQRNVPCADCPVEKTLQSGQPQEAEITSPDGRSWFIRGYPVREPNGDIVGLVEVTLDISERKRAEEALRRERDLMGRIMETSPAGITMIDREGQITFANVQAERVLGLKKDQITQRTYNAPQWRITDYEGNPFPDEALPFQRVMRSGRPVYDVRHAIEWPEGRRVLLSINAAPLFDEAGQVDGMVATVEDVTERVWAERLLQALNGAALAMERALTPEEIFTAVAEEFKKLSLSCTVLLTSEDQSRLIPKYLSHEAGAIKAAEKLVGLKAEHFSVPVETIDIYREVAWERKTVFVDNAEEVVQQFLPGLAKRFAGQLVRILKVPKFIVAPLIVEDKAMGMFAVQSDALTEDNVPAITAFAHQMAAAWRKANLMQDLESSLEELNRTQEQLVRVQKMEAVGRLAGGVAHDFNNLLTAITGYSELLLQNLADHDPLHQDVEQIRKAAQRAASLTRQLLAFSRRQALQPQVLDLNATVADMKKMLRRLIGEDIELVTVLEPERWTVKADPGQLEQVIMNLTVNARDAMPQGGRLTIKTENVTLDQDYCQLIPEARPGRFVCLSVEDTGAGMDKETIQHIFEPFFTTKGEEGTGLGLAVVYGIVRQHEGWINVYSEPGRGSTFRVYLPTFSIEPEEDEIEEMISLQELQGRGQRILVVEDEAGVRAFARRALVENGYVVFEAASAEEAVAIFEREEGDFHLVFSDVVLPDAVGLQLVDHLLSLKPALRVLLSSGYADRKSQWPLICERGFPFLQKPYASAALLQTIREAIEPGQEEKG